MQHVQDELSAAVEGMAPPSMKKAERIPFLSTDEGIGASWNLVAQTQSEQCGLMLVEEQPSFDGSSCTRRLIFASNRDMIQSESRFILFITRWSFRCRTKSNKIIHHVVCRRCVRCPRAA